MSASTRHAVIRGPSLTGLGRVPSFTFRHNVAEEVEVLGSTAIGERNQLQAVGGSKRAGVIAMSPSSLKRQCRDLDKAPLCGPDGHRCIANDLRNCGRVATSACFSRAFRDAPSRWFSMVLAATRAPMQAVSLAVDAAALDGLATLIRASFAEAAMISKSVDRSRRPTGPSTPGFGFGNERLQSRSAEVRTTKTKSEGRPAAG